MTSCELTSSSAHIFPHNDTDQLLNEAGYYPWLVRMKNDFEICKMWDVVSEIEAQPSNDIFTSSNTGEIWLKTVCSVTFIMTDQTVDIGQPFNIVPSLWCSQHLLKFGSMDG